MLHSDSDWRWPASGERTFWIQVRHYSINAFQALVRRG
jgi:hypothetical protein